MGVSFKGDLSDGKMLSMKNNESEFFEISQNLHFSGDVFVMRNNRQLIKKFIELKNGSDLFCYYSETNRKKVIFMHSLIGCHIEKLSPFDNQYEDNKFYYRLQIHLS